jgi:hypothetical protein
MARSNVCSVSCPGGQFLESELHGDLSDNFNSFGILFKLAAIFKDFHGTF